MLWLPLGPRDWGLGSASNCEESRHHGSGTAYCCTVSAITEGCIAALVLHWLCCIGITCELAYLYTGDGLLDVADQVLITSRL